jgi:hypothetical protein
MNPSKIVFLINESTRAVMGVYEEHQKPTMFKTFDPDIAVNDLVVVESDTRHGMTVVKITAVDVDVNFDESDKVKWVVQRIDTPAFAKTIAQEQAAISAVAQAEQRRKREELRASLFRDHEEKIKTLEISKDPSVTE